MDCKTALILGLFYAVGCEGRAAEAGVEAAPPITQEQPAALTQKRTGRRTGLTLKDLVADMEWRKKTYQRMAESGATGN